MPAAAFAYSGVIPILATPFHPDESLDLESLERVVRFNSRIGADAVTVLGVLGESNRLTDAERERVVRTAVKAAEGLPVIVGTSHTGTEATIALSEQAADLGATAVMVAPSAQPVPSDRVVIDYYHRIASKIRLPIVLQDHPASTGVHLPVDVVLQLARELPKVACIKAEAVPTPPKIAALKKGLAGIRPVPVLTGLGALYGLFDLERGSDGFNTGFAFPEVLLALVRSHRAGQHELARKVFTRYLPLMVFEQQPGLAIRKEILRRRGLIASNRVRHPGATIDPAAAEQLGRLLEATFPAGGIDGPIDPLAGL
ncbi:MAG TPA: dihydrodipicolinate synthase family protein [Opitutaceae bacterium]|nr:dihydrodipicolinate synthase family protein [Opitutaceae bacterium]